MKLLAVLVITIGAIWALVTFSRSPIEPGSNPLLSTPQPSALTVAHDDSQYQLFLQHIGDPARLTLIPNFVEKNSTQTLISNHACLYGVNGGFYTPQAKPLGVFCTRGKCLGQFHSESLFNGFISKTEAGSVKIAGISPRIDDSAFEFIIQSGPLFIPATKLLIKNDESARRVLIGKTDTNDFYFVAITETENVNSGPLLADLPAIIDKYNSQLTTYNLQLTTLLNLDGGSASAFYDDSVVRLTELTPVGSFLCGKN